MKKFIFLTVAFLIASAAVFAGVDHTSIMHFFATPDVHNFGVPTLAFSMVAVTDITRGRCTYERIQELAPGFIIENSYIRSEQLIKNTSSNYNFEVRETILAGQTAFPLQYGVADNDLFFANAWGLFIDYRLSTKPSIVVLQQYPNSVAFTPSGATVSDLEAFFNGQIEFQVGSTVFFSAYDTQRMRKVPQTQQSLLANFSQSSINENLIPCDPHVVLSGKATNKITLSIITNSTFAAAATTENGQNIATLYLSGYVIKNGANDPDIQARLEGMGIKLTK